MEKLSKKIQKLMAQKNLGATDISRKTGLNRNTIYSIVAGNSKDPSAKTMQLLAKAFGVSVESLLLDEEYVTETLTKRQLKLFYESSNAVINTVIEKELDFSLEQLNKLIFTMYDYSLRKNTIDMEFLDFMLEKYINVH